MKIALHLPRCNCAVSLAYLAFATLVPAAAHAQTCNPTKTITKPDALYSAMNNGAEVKDNVTKLIWQRCTLGQKWNGKTCIGTALGASWDSAKEASKPVTKKPDAITVQAIAQVSVQTIPEAPTLQSAPALADFDAAVAAVGDDAEVEEPEVVLPNKPPVTNPLVTRNLEWRLPSLKELYTLAELACTGPAINTLWFPSTPSKFYWSDSSFSDDENFAWGVDFGGGRAGYDAKKGVYSVRLVRTAP